MNLAEKIYQYVDKCEGKKTKKLPSSQVTVISTYYIKNDNKSYILATDSAILSSAESWLLTILHSGRHAILAFLIAIGLMTFNVVVFDVHCMGIKQFFYTCI